MKKMKSKGKLKNNISKLFTLLLASSSTKYVQSAFTSPQAIPIQSFSKTSRLISTPSSYSSHDSSTSRKALQIPQLEDLIYTAQSTASSLASTSLTSNTSSTSPSSLAILYFAGLLTSFSPCSLGLLPLTISYISSATGERDDRNVFFPTVAFATGLASVFCGLGISASLLGNVFGSSDSSNGWSTLILAGLSSGISIAMGLQLLDLVSLPLPSLELELGGGGGGNTVVAASTSTSSSELLFDEEGNIIPPSSSSSEDSAPTEEGGGGGSALFRTFLLGGSSALVASPCATPVLTSILAFVASTRDEQPFLGAILLFIYTIGYSTPLLVVGASGGQALANASAAAAAEEDSILGRVGAFVSPVTAGILIWYGMTGFLDALLGDPSLAGLAPILD